MEIVVKHLMGKPRPVVLGDAVMHFLAYAPVLYQAVHFQSAEMVRDCGIRHFHGCCDIADAFLRMANQPKDAESGRIAELLKRCGRFRKLFTVRHFPEYDIKRMAVVVR